MSSPSAATGSGWSSPRTTPSSETRRGGPQVPRIGNAGEGPVLNQTAPAGEPHFVMTMAEHMQMCGQMARAFGNDAFEPLAPRDEVLYLVDNHDRGWDEYDGNPGLDDDRLPFIMSRTPTPENMNTN